MKKNVGSTDQLLRLTVAGIIAIALYLNWIIAPWSLVFSIVALILIGTSITSFCPLYRLFGFTTCKTPQAK